MDNDSRGQSNFKWWYDRATISGEQSSTNLYDESIFITTKTIYEYFDSQVYGLEDYKKMLPVAMWNDLHRQIKTNFLCIGELGKLGIDESKQSFVFTNEFDKCI